MTLDDFKIPLFTFFSNNKIFDLEKNYKEVTISSLEIPEVNRAIVLLVLKEFEKQFLIFELPDQKDNKRKWILNKDLAKYSQSIELHYATLAAIVKIINNFCERSGDIENNVDPLMITEKNIQDLCLLADQFVNPIQKNA